MSFVMPSTEQFDVPRAPLWGIGQCTLAAGVVDTPISWEEIERDAAWMTDRLAEYGFARGDIAVVVSGPAEVTWSHPTQIAVSRLGGVYAMAWTTRFDARRAGALARMLSPKMVIGIGAATVDGLAELPAGIAGEIGAVPYVLARAGAHAQLEVAGISPFLFDLVGPATVMESPDRNGARVNASEWRIGERDGVLAVTTVGDRQLRLDASPTTHRGSVLTGADTPGGPRVTIEPVAR